MSGVCLCLGEALAVQRSGPPSTWRAACDGLPERCRDSARCGRSDAGCRATVLEYLSGIVLRMREQSLCKRLARGGGRL